MQFNFTTVGMKIAFKETVVYQLSRQMESIAITKSILVIFNLNNFKIQILTSIR